MSAPSSAESLQSTIPSTHHFVHHPATAWIGDKLRGKRGYPAEDMTLEQLSQRVSHVSIAPTDATRSVKYRWPACHKEQIVLDDEVWTGYEQTTRNGLLAADSPPAIFIKTSDANGDPYLEIIRNL